MFEDMDFTVDTQLKLNVHKTFTRRSKRCKNALCTLNLDRVFRSVKLECLKRLVVNYCFANLSILDVCQRPG